LASQQEYLGLPDGQLDSHLGELTASVIWRAVINESSALVTLGPNGYDGHQDHVATYLAAVCAQRILLEDHNVDVALISLDPKDSGEIVVQACPRQKLALLAIHQTQSPIRVSDDARIHIIDNEHWGFFQRTYGRLIYDRESYSVS
jgi:LmbE family N-acetylglucosaminyl deacetylase